jgi:hypothetical protein
MFIHENNILDEICKKKKQPRIEFRVLLYISPLRYVAKNDSVRLSL